MTGTLTSAQQVEQTLTGTIEEQCERWAASVMPDAYVEELDPGCFAAQISDWCGAWTTDTSPDDALAALPDVLFDWLSFAFDDLDEP